MTNPNPLQPAAEPFGNIPQASEAFGKIPNPSEDFRTVRNDSEAFGSMPKGAERKENHTLSVREVARMFEDEGVARTERSIVNWCQPNAQGIARLDAYFDPNERKYYIAPQSVKLAIAEEQAKVARNSPSPEMAGKLPHNSETSSKKEKSAHLDNSEIESLERQLRDLQITNRAKDFVIDQMKIQHDADRQNFVEQLVLSSQRVGQLENKLLQLETPVNNQPPTVEGGAR